MLTEIYMVGLFITGLATGLTLGLVPMLFVDGIGLMAYAGVRAILNYLDGNHG